MIFGDSYGGAGWPIKPMLNMMRRLFAKGPAMAEPLALQRWAQQHGHDWRRVRDAEGCVIEGKQDQQAWRIEWGASQRNYVDGLELRLIAELDLPNDLMVMVLNRSLMAAMEKAVYEQYVDDVQTRIDTDTPPEMRWLVMHAKLPSADLGPLRERYGAVSSLPSWLSQWLQSPLGEALAATLAVIRSDQPVALTVGRGRLTLRTELQTPDADKLALWFVVFEQAMKSARTLVVERRPSGSRSKPADAVPASEDGPPSDLTEPPEPSEPAPMR